MTEQQDSVQNFVQTDEAAQQETACAECVELPNGSLSAANEMPEAVAPRGRNRVYFTASRIAKLALFAALAYAVTFLEFPVFPATPFLKLDFSLVFVLLGGYMFGPVAVIVIGLVKELLSFLDTGTGGIGEIANFIVTLSFAVAPAWLYRYQKGLKWVIVSLAAATVFMAVVSLLVNRFINYPLFFKGEAASMFAAQWGFVFAFNLIKGAAVSTVTIVLYKRISWLLNKF